MTMRGSSGRVSEDSTVNDDTFQPVAVSAIVAAYLPSQVSVPKDDSVPTASMVIAWLTERVTCASSRAGSSASSL